MGIMFANLGKGIDGEELMKSVNFEFLRPSFPELADLGGFAEHCAFSDPSSALIKLRVFPDTMVSAIYSRRILDMETDTSKLGLSAARANSLRSRSVKILVNHAA